MHDISMLNDSCCGMKYQKLWNHKVLKSSLGRFCVPHVRRWFLFILCAIIDQRCQAWITTEDSGFLQADSKIPFSVIRGYWRCKGFRKGQGTFKASWAIVHRSSAAFACSLASSAKDSASSKAVSSCSIPKLQAEPTVLVRS